MIRERDLNVIYVTGPGHGGPALVANAYLEGTYSEVYPHIGRDEDGLRRLFRQFSFPGRHPQPRRARDARLDPRGRRARLLRSLHAYGAAFDNPDLLVVLRGRRRRGRDRPAGGELALEQVPEPVTRRRGAADPAPQRLQDRQPDRAGPDPATTSSTRCSRATATRRCFVEGDDPTAMHQLMAAALDEALDEIAEIQRRRAPAAATRPAALADDRAAHAEGLDRARRRSTACRSRARSAPTRCRSPTSATNPEHLAQLEEWMRTYRPEELFDDDGRAARRARRAARPTGERRMSANPHANGGLLLRDLELPDFRDYAVDVAAARAPATSEATRVLGDVPARRDRAQPDDASGSSAPTRRPRTGSAPCSR